MSAKRKTVAIIAITVMTLLPGCSGAPAAVEAIQAAKLLIEALSAADTVVRLYERYVSESVERTRRALYEDLVLEQMERNRRAADNGQQILRVRIDLPAIALDWENSWRRVEEQTEALEECLDTIQFRSQVYWTTLGEVANAIKDDALRAQEQIKNLQAKRKWDQAYANAEYQVERARAICDRGADFHKVLLGSALRSEISQQTTTLNLIATEAEALLKTLETLTEQGRLLVIGNP